MEKKYISFSGGVESRTMALLYGYKADAIFSDTGSEHDELYKQLEDVEKVIREFHGNNFKIIKVKNEKYESLESYIRESSFFPNFQARFCTRMFKIEPIDNYLKKYKKEGVELMIGLNSDEQDLRTGNHGLLSFVNYSYPLADNGINRNMCYKILDAAGIRPNFPAYMQRGGCKFCYYKSKKEYEAMAILNEKEFDEVADLENDIQDKRDKFFHIISSIPNLREFKKHAKAILFNPDEIYPVINNVTNCGVFCNR